MTNRETDVFIISFNRLSYLKKLIGWLEKAGFENIHIVDNNSTYPPLLEYLAATEHKVHRLEKNYGHLVVWESGKFRDIIEKKYYIVSDCDIFPVEECPPNLCEYFSGILQKYPAVSKVGFALKIDDLPDRYIHKKSVTDWEKRFWEKKIAENLFEAPIDTTFALYRPGIYPQDKKWFRAIRTGFPYVARHLPWYEDSQNPDEEENFYQKNMRKRHSFWSITDPDQLKLYNRELLAELETVYASRRWRYLRNIYGISGMILGSDRFRNKFSQKKISPVGDMESAPEIQKANEKILVELGTIYSSAGWRLFEKFIK